MRWIVERWVMMPRPLRTAAFLVEAADAKAAVEILVGRKWVLEDEKNVRCTLLSEWYEVLDGQVQKAPYDERDAMGPAEDAWFDQEDDDQKCLVLTPGV